MTSFDAVGFGALNIDKLFSVNRIASAEEESFITDSVEVCGGSAANVAVGLARLGCKVGFIGKVAGDREGTMLLNDFRRENVDVNGIIKTKRGRSGKAIGFVDEKGNRALYVDPGVNDTLELEELTRNYACRTDFLHLTSFVGEKPFQAQKKLVEMLPEDVKISFDPGHLYARKTAALEPIITRTFLLMPNAKELELLTGKFNYKKSAEVLCRKGVKTVAVKLGGKGCYITDGSETHLIKAFKVKVVDTTGAGDAFCAGFLYGLLSNKSLYESGRIGNFVASRSIMKTGARTGLPHNKDLELLY